MSQFRTIRIGNNPLLVIASAVVAFGVTHFYFNQPDGGTLALFIGRIMLIPLHAIVSICHLLGIPALADNVLFIFAVLFITYTVLALVGAKILELIALRRQNRAARHL